MTTSRVISTPIGQLLAEASERGVSRCDFIGDMGDESPTRVIGHSVVLDHLATELHAYFSGALRVFTVPLDPVGTPFELKAWLYLRSIPFGQTHTYGQQAAAVATAAACRAVGRANGRNPIAIVVPCHRVIGAGGSLTGYAGGLHRKRWLLDHEQSLAGRSLFAASKEFVRC